MPYCRARFLSRFKRFLLIVAIFFALCACDDEQPWKVGFIGGLTGRVADLGVAGRDGLIFAVEEKNEAGGIAGRKIELVVRDDMQSPDIAPQVVNELINEGVVAIIGPMTSSVGVVVKPAADKGKTVVISPTVKTDQLSGLDDYFFRVTTPLSKNAKQTVNYATQTLGLKKFAVILDISNSAFTKTWLNYFKEALSEKGGEVVVVEEFESRPDVYFLPIAQKILAKEPEGVLLLSNAIDTAMLAQQLRKLGSKVPLFSSEWAFTTDLISFGGRAVEGMTSFHSFHVNETNEVYSHFKQRFVKRFGYDPSFATALSYDAAILLFKGLEKTSQNKSLKEALVNLGPMPGLQSMITVDQYGDVDRQLFLTTVDNGEFRVAIK